MSLQTPGKIRKLQRGLYRKAKQEPEFRFYILYDKVYREDILRHAYRLARANDGSPGVDGVTFEDIEEQGLEEWLEALGEELRRKTYEPDPTRRKMIPKPGGGERPLGIPTLRDRVVQTAAKLVLEPVFEADFDECAFGYRPGRSAQDAVEAVHDTLIEGYTDVVDADVSGYFDSIPHDALMQSVARRVVDKHMLKLVKGWLKAPVEVTDESGRTRLVGGKGSRTGTPQGGVISPLLANIYMHRYLRAWRDRGKGEEFQARVVNYADDFVILCRGKADQALAWTRWAMEQMGLELNERKTRLCDASEDTFDFLGYTFGPECYRKTGQWYTAAQPSGKAVSRMKQAVRGLLRRSRGRPWEEVTNRLNSLLSGWGNYFSYGSLSRAYGVVDKYVERAVRDFLCRRHKVSGRGIEQFPIEVLREVYGVPSVWTLR